MTKFLSNTGFWVITGMTTEIKIFGKKKYVGFENVALMVKLVKGKDFKMCNT